MGGNHDQKNEQKNNPVRKPLEINNPAQLFKNKFCKKCIFQTGIMDELKAYVWTNKLLASLTGLLQV